MTLYIETIRLNTNKPCTIKKTHIISLETSIILSNWFITTTKNNTVSVSSVLVRIWLYRLPLLSTVHFIFQIFHGKIRAYIELFYCCSSNSNYYFRRGKWVECIRIGESDIFSASLFIFNYRSSTLHDPPFIGSYRRHIIRVFIYS